MSILEMKLLNVLYVRDSTDVSEEYIASSRIGACCWYLAYY
jgi:hypothetical protein